MWWAWLVVLWALAVYDDGDPVDDSPLARQPRGLERPLLPRHFGWPHPVCGNKYFHEVGDHFDARFFRARPRYYANQATLWRLARAWLGFAHTHQLDTWLAHGTLLGWWWNGLPLPWDNDLDVQVTAEAFGRLVAMNQTAVAVDGHRYLVDVSPYWGCRNASGNAIDGRFIDESTGMYVDITVLLEADTVPSVGESREFDRVVDPEWDPATGDHELWTLRRDLLALVACKDHHYFAVAELTPLVPVEFVGMPAYVPAGYEAILAREYPRGLRDTVYGDHSWHPGLRMWVRHWVCPVDRRCRNTRILEVAESVGELTKERVAERVAGRRREAVVMAAAAAETT